MMTRFSISRGAKRDPQSSSSDWINPSGMKGVALQQATDRKTEAPQNTVAVDSDAGVFRAGRLKTARRAKQRGDPILVANQQSDTQVPHFSPLRFGGDAGEQEMSARPLPRQRTVDSRHHVWERLRPLIRTAGPHAPASSVLERCASHGSGGQRSQISGQR
jgi:hypothetical protein